MNEEREKSRKRGGEGSRGSKIDVYWWRNILQCLELDQLPKCHNQLTGAQRLQCAHKSRLKMQLYDNSQHNSIQGDNSNLLKNGKPITTHLSALLA